MGEVVPARTSPTLHPPSPPTVHQLSRLALQELISSFIICMTMLTCFAAAIYIVGQCIGGMIGAGLIYM